jgi:hypothetical protein
MQIELAKTVAAAAGHCLLDPGVRRRLAGNHQLDQEYRSFDPGPVQTGTRLREDRIMLGAEVTQEVEIATIECPHRLRLLVDHPDLHYELDHLVDAVYGGSCRMMLIFRSSPATAAGRVLQPLMSPFMGVTLRDELEQDLSDLATAVSRRGLG